MVAGWDWGAECGTEWVGGLRWLCWCPYEDGGEMGRGGTGTYRVYLPVYVCVCRSISDEQAVRCWWRWCFRRVRVRDWGRE
jgi:hypothetical protein